jgi:peptidoglycan hydrolase CwlO-like protein
MMGFGSVLTVFTGGANEIEKQHQELEKKEEEVEKRIVESQQQLKNENISKEEKAVLTKGIDTLKKKGEEYKERKQETVNKMKALTSGLIQLAEKAKNDLYAQKEKIKSNINSKIEAKKNPETVTTDTVTTDTVTTSSK